MFVLEWVDSITITSMSMNEKAEFTYLELRCSMFAA